MAIENSIVPVVWHNGTLIVPMSNLDFMVLDNLRFLLNQQVSAAIATPDDIQEALGPRFPFASVPTPGDNRATPPGYPCLELRGPHGTADPLP